MKRIFLLLAVVLFSAITQAQMSNLIFFSEQGERFSVILNGVLQNANPETNIKVTDLPAPSYKLKIIFDDTKLSQIDKNLMYKQGFESTFVIKKNNKGEYIARWMNDVPLAQAMPPSPGQSIIVYTTIPAVPQTTTVTQSLTTTTTRNDNTSGASVGISVNDPDMAVNLNLNLNGNGTGSSSQTTTYSTTTTTTTSGTPDQTYPTNPPPKQDFVLPDYNGPYGCRHPMSPQDFNSAKQSISSKSFEDSKLAIAKQIINTNCLLSAQVKEIMLLFSFEDTRLDLAKYSYGYTWDIGNYYKLNDAFTFESSIDELNAFINGSSR
ncbi:MAG: DUF4476 domain-containing protein [Bacteroidales bacterium]